MKHFFQIKPNFIGILMGIAILFCVSFIFSNRLTELFKFGTEIMSLIYDIGVSTIAAGIFYYVQVYLPEKKKKRIIKENLKKYWLQTKKNIISNLLYFTYPANLLEKLCDFQYFREYFSEKHETEEGQTKWHGVLNNLSKDSINDIILEFDGLIREIDFLLTKIEVHDNEVFEFLKRFQYILYHHKIIRMEYGEEKELSRLLWDILGSTSIITGPRDSDIMETMINKL